MARERINTINEYLEVIKEDLDTLNSKYTQEALNDLDAFYTGRVYDCVNKLRTILDMCYFDIVDKVIRSSSKATTDKDLIKALKGNLFFPYYYKSTSELMGNPILIALSVLNKDLFNIIESCQPYKDAHQAIKMTCYLSNKTKHDNDYQKKNKHDIVSIGNTNSDMSLLILQDSKNIILEGELIVNGVTIFRCENITISGLITPQFEIVESSGIRIFGSQINGVRADKSKVLLHDNSIQGRTQHNGIGIHDANWNIEEGDYHIRNGIRTPIYPPDNYDIRLVNEVHFTVEGTHVKIIELLNSGFEKVSEIVTSVYGILSLP